MTASNSPDAVEAKEAAALFAEFAANQDLAWHFPTDGCYARTHIMVQEMLEKGLAPKKIWAFAADAEDPLWTETDQGQERIEWRYHVAPTLTVLAADGEIEDMVLDPLLFEELVSVDTWRIALHDTPTMVQTIPGEPPLPSAGGSGYWPAPDPLEGPDVHAQEVLEDYGA